MRKVLLVLVMLVAVVASGQRVTKRKALKTTDLGNQKLEAVISATDTIYVISLKTGSMGMKYVTVELGDAERALRLLTFLEG